MKVAKLPTGSPEIFYTIQGEGQSSGKPSIFLRLLLCNLHCFWCDTPYTWNWEGTSWETEGKKKFQKTDQIIDMSVEDIRSALDHYPCKNLVITGGEPLIQQNELHSLISLLDEQWNIEIETNGTILPTALEQHKHIHYNVSQKLSHSGNSKEIAENPESLAWFSMLPRATFKFVVSSPADLAEIKSLQKQYKISAEKIILMPEGTTSEKLHKNAAGIIALCMEHGYRYSDRLHVHIWGNERAK